MKWKIKCLFILNSWATKSIFWYSNLFYFFRRKTEQTKYEFCVNDDQITRCIGFRWYHYHATNHECQQKNPLNITWMQLIWFSLYGQLEDVQINTVYVHESNWWVASRTAYMWFAHVMSNQSTFIKYSNIHGFCVANAVPKIECFR